MNVFEDLVVELKENNLLESTVIENEQSEITGTYELSDTQAEEIDYELHDNATEQFSIGETSAIDGLADDILLATDIDESQLPDSSDEHHEAGLIVETSSEIPAAPVPDKKADAFKKRAVSEVSSLQMVEHVLTGVEREYLKIVPKGFDDLNAKKALHAFLNSDGNSENVDPAAAEFSLLRETEAWCTALGERDRNIPVSSFRLYCENSKPALSSQALVGLARFYRNLPYSEQVRSKFDFTITRLFSRPIQDEKRVCLFDREGMLNHVTTLYKEWSSIPLYAADDDESKVLLTALSFEDLADEAEQASTFDQLITSDFFSRLRLFKESISELFFAPNVTAAAIDCNIRIGNAYVTLIHREREKLTEASIESKYGDLNEQAVSDAAARTLQMVDLLRGPIDVETSEPAHVEAEPAQQTAPAAWPVSAKEVKPPKDLPPFLARLPDNAASVNKWFLAGAMLLVVCSVGIWVWANYVVETKAPNTGVETVNLAGSFMSEHIKTARVSTGNFYGVLEPTWDTLPKEKRQEFAAKVLQAGQERGFSQVNLISKDGKMAAFASSARVEIIMP